MEFALAKTNQPIAELKMLIKSIGRLPILSEREPKRIGKEGEKRVNGKRIVTVFGEAPKSVT